MSKTVRTFTEESETTAHGVTASNVGGDTYRALIQQGASVSPFAAGGGASEAMRQALKFKAFEMLPAEEGGGMIRTEAFSGENPAPLCVPDPSETAADINPPAAAVNSSDPLPLTPIPAPSVADIINVPAPVAPVAPVVLREDPGTPGIAPQPSILHEKEEPLQLTRKVYFVTPVGDFPLDFYSATVEGQWLTLIGPGFPKLIPDSVIDLKIDSTVLHCYCPGINVEIKLGKHTARIAHFLISQP